MIVAESRRGRRIVGRLDRGVDLFSTLETICRERGVRTAELRALGSLESIEVAEFDQAAKVWKPGRKFAGGGFEVLNLTGNVSERDGNLALHAHATLMRDRDNGVELVGGHVVAARVFALEFVLETFDDLILRRAADPATGLTLWREALELPGPTPAAAAVARAEADTQVPVARDMPAPTARFAPPTEVDEAPHPRFEGAPPPRVSTAQSSAVSPSWRQVAAASETATAAARAAAAVEEDTDEGLTAGDLLVHPTFGKCEVQRIEGAYEFAHVRLRNGRLVRLSLDVLKLSSAGREDGKRLFRARVE